MAVDGGTQTECLLLKGKQYSYVAWYRVRKGPSDDEYEANLPLASTLLSSKSTWLFTDGAELLPCPFNQYAHGAKLLPCP